jgi:CheY-like chemotaxis protein
MNIAALPEVDSVARRGTILVVEDRDDVRQGVAQLLEMNGFLVADAPDGEAALQQLTTDPEGFALILLDLAMPGEIGGREFRQEQLADPSLASVPTIVVTATDLDQNERVGLRPDAWLDKPFRFEDLLELVKRYVVSEGALGATAPFEQN